MRPENTCQSLRPVMFVGTGSDVGKSILNTAFCRIFKQDGYRPAPFKAQNMSLNSYATPDGLEIGRAQAVQAEACELPCHTDMNPVLLKPTNHLSSQVVLHGKPVGNQSARDYFLADNRKELFAEVTSAFERLNRRYNPVVLEGAGSISELNLKERDITNMNMALAAQAAVYLVADIDRGGVFASVYGSIALLTEEERALVKGIIINKFRGDISLFDEGRKMLEELTGKPVVGVVPYYTDIHIEEEDSVALMLKNKHARQGQFNIAVVRLPCMSNYTDFDYLERHPEVNLYFTLDARELMKAEVIILPGSKNTQADLQALKASGIAATILKAYEEGKKVIGICGGYQMLGQKISDPYGVEEGMEELEGLGLLPVETVMGKEKIIRQQVFRFLHQEEICRGYEIHMGISTLTENVARPVVREDGVEEGCYLNDRCWGSYMHGILDNATVINTLLDGRDATGCTEDLPAFKARQYDALAGHVRAHVDLEQIYNHLIIH